MTYLSSTRENDNRNHFLKVTMNRVLLKLIDRLFPESVEVVTPYSLCSKLLVPEILSLESYALELIGMELKISGSELKVRAELGILQNFKNFMKIW